ncbi:MAG: orotidine-5'-phosphate decarboxylase [Methylobacteriaceae bacterium]|jgi:orotidine-5'-phosphate decarboxylase|nr:orotidine-5'-phosphate decarboxylase [Methylobacteriaceae bacterium]
MPPVIIALDFENREKLERFLIPFGNEKLFLKIGMELYYRTGNDLVTDLKSRGHRVFLDLKLHDIPNTVECALSNLVKLDPDYITIHASGGAEMMRRAAGAVTGTNTRLLAITILTSISEAMLRDDLRVEGNVRDMACHYACRAKDSGVHGVICSPHEAAAIREKAGADFLIVTPGIRLLEDDVNDQKRVMTPENAMALGANQLVIGRSITTKADPVSVYRSIVTSLSKGQEGSPWTSSRVC